MIDFDNSNGTDYKRTTNLHDGSWVGECHTVDDDGRPAGGFTEGTGFRVDWQNGPLGRGEDRQEPNGAFVEGIITAALGRLEFYNSGQFRCRENSLAITHLEEALHWCNHRTAAREAREVEGTHEI